MQDQFDDESRGDRGSGGEYANLAECSHVPGVGVLLAPDSSSQFFLIIAGTLLFLDNIGLIPVHDIWDSVESSRRAEVLSRVAELKALKAGLPQPISGN